MNNNGQHLPEEMKADLEQVSGLVDFLWEKLGEYSVNNKITLLAVFMGVHNFHVRVAVDIATKWSVNHQGVEKTLQMADQTFRKAIRQLRRLS